jgi:hypothetical protein
MTWPPRSPDVTPCDFFLRGHVKDLVYVPPFQEKRYRPIDVTQFGTAASVTAVEQLLQGLDYRIDLSHRQ